MTCEHGLTTKECYVCSSPKYGEKKMTTLKTLEMALEALEISIPTTAGREAITALRQQIALEKQQPADEPVAWMHVQGDYEEPSLFQLDGPSMDRGWEQYPLYTHPQKAAWVGLTDEEIKSCAKEHLYCEDSHYNVEDGIEGWKDFACAIEAKLKEKNT
mgnify:CR=1 FL=1